MGNFTGRGCSLPRSTSASVAIDESTAILQGLQVTHHQSKHPEISEINPKKRI
jgi:hypothetical protein